MIYFTSDLHFNHSKDFLYEPRGFENVVDMNNKIIENWNNIIKPDDDIYVLGDLMLGDNECGARCIKNLKGNIHIILGNHDTAARVEIYNNLYNVVEIEYGLPFKYNSYRFFLSHYPCLTSNYDVDKPLKNRVINLCGHSHCKDKFQDFNKGLIYHVELDAHNNTPVSIEQIIKDIKRRIS